MAFISPLEIFYLLITVAGVGYIFTGFIRRPSVDPLLSVKRFNWEDFKYACLVASPGIILHELAHKFVAMGFGLKAVYEAWFTGLGIGVVLKFIGSGFILLAPGYVKIFGGDTLTMTVSAFAGPAVNLILWLGAAAYLKHGKNLTRMQAMSAGLLKQINMWLFIFNMLPIPPLDGAKVWFGLYQLLFV